MKLIKKEIELTKNDLNYINQFELEPILDNEEMIGWNGYVDLKGNFYRTKPLYIDYYNGSFNVHKDWATAYIMKNYGYNECELPREVEGEEIYGAQDWLVQGEGWASCTFDSLVVGIQISKKGYDCDNLTEPQRKTIFKLFQLNKFPMEKYYDQCESIPIETNYKELNI